MKRTILLSIAVCLSSAAFAAEHQCVPAMVAWYDPVEYSTMEENQKPPQALFHDSVKVTVGCTEFHGDIVKIITEFELEDGRLVPKEATYIHRALVKSIAPMEVHNENPRANPRALPQGSRHNRPPALRVSHGPLRGG